MPKEQEAWPAIKLSRREPRCRPEDMSSFPTCKCGCQSGEAETYLPVSASQPLVEALEGIAAQTTDHVAASRAFAVLSDFKAQSEPKEAASAAPEGEAR